MWASQLQIFDDYEMTKESTQYYYNLNKFVFQSQNMLINFSNRVQLFFF